MENSDKEPIVAVSNRRRGRPKGSVSMYLPRTAPVKKPKKPPKKMGRPKEIGTKVQELKDRLLNSADSSRIVNTIIKKALNDDDKDQMVALKLCLDRILPVSMFEKAKDQRSAIQINITGLHDVAVTDNHDDAEDAVIVEER
jgi:hypothetical protein